MFKEIGGSPYVAKGKEVVDQDKLGHHHGWVQFGGGHILEVDRMLIFKTKRAAQRFLEGEMMVRMMVMMVVRMMVVGTRQKGSPSPLPPPCPQSPRRRLGWRTMGHPQALPMVEVEVGAARAVGQACPVHPPEPTEHPGVPHIGEAKRVARLIQ